MSVKSRKKADNNHNKHSPSNLLFLQKQAIRNAMLEHLGASVLFLVFAIAVVIIVSLNEFTSPKSPGLILAELCIFAIYIYYLVSFARRFLIFRQLSKIKFSTEQSVSLYCRNIQFYLQPVSRFSSVVLCIVLVDKNGNKFYYVHPMKRAPFDFSRKLIKEKYIGTNVELICYQNTNIVKTLPL